MDFRQVRYFLAIAEHENFRRAAEALGVAQSALSKHIIELEARLALKLFDRIPKGVRLTPAGRVYAEEARQSLALMERAEKRAQKAARGEIERLTLAMNDIAARSLPVGRSVAAFAAAVPEVQLDFIAMVSQQQLTELRYGKIDAGFLIDRPPDESLAYVQVARDPFWLAMPRSHRLADREVVAPSELSGEAFVSVSMSTYWLPQTRLLAQCRALGLIPRIVQEAGNDHMQMSFIAAGMGVGFVNASMADFLDADMLMRPVAGLDVSLELALVWNRKSTSPALANFVETVRRVVENS